MYLLRTSHIPIFPWAYRNILEVNVQAGIRMKILSSLQLDATFTAAPGGYPASSGTQLLIHPSALVYPAERSRQVAAKLLATGEHAVRLDPRRRRAEADGGEE